MAFLSWGYSRGDSLWAGRESHKTGHPRLTRSLSPSLSLVFRFSYREIERRERKQNLARARRVRHFPKCFQMTERKTYFLVVRFVRQTFLTMLFSSLNITNSSMVLCVWICFFTSYFRFVFFIICLLGFTYYKKILQ